MIASALTRLAPRVVRQLQRPSLVEALMGGTGLMDVLAQICPEWRQYDHELTVLRRELTERYSSHSLRFVQQYAIESATEALIYVLVRTQQPALVVETGVANGNTTVVLLAALRANGSGVLHSTDVCDGVGGLLTLEERRAWNFHRLPPGGSRAAFSHLLADLGPIDIFLHDSEHTYAWQRFEYESVFPRLTPGGWLISDDVDASYAFLDFRDQHGLTAVAGLDNRKVVALIRHI